MNDENLFENITKLCILALLMSIIKLSHNKNNNPHNCWQLILSAMSGSWPWYWSTLHHNWMVYKNILPDLLLIIPPWDRWVDVNCKKKVRTYNEKIGLREFNTHKINWMQEKQKETTSKLLNEFVWVDGRTRTKMVGQGLKEQQNTRSCGELWLST